MGHKSNQLLADRIAALPRPATSWQKWIVTGGGVGFLRPAPGSWGTCPPALLYFLALLANFPDPRRSLALLGFGMIAGGLLIAYGKWAAAWFREPDPGSVILDEYAGFAVTCAFVPIPDWFTAHGTLGLFAFTSILYLLFRATDTLKLPPANYLEKLPWGWGILCDDLAAGVQANLLAQLLVFLIQHYAR
ncbi:MAG TPA: phosphatidylglycerophosphatase A [Phycisphaerae bacterium]|nr:phosphatidylglycerophosphatase A [Phycisphaerae bacterium]